MADIKDAPQSDMGQVLYSLGQITGTLKAMHEGLTAQIGDIRKDIARIESAQGERMDRMENAFNDRMTAVEENVGRRIDSMGTRVTALEAEDKRLIEKTARLSALGGGLGGALAAGAVELIKRI